MPLVSSYHFLLGPIVAVVAVGVLVLICRWVFSTDHRETRADLRLQKLLAAGDYGLLVPVSTVRTRDDAEMLRDVLVEAGLRANITAGAAQGEFTVLVFSKDAARARQLVAAN